MGSLYQRLHGRAEPKEPGSPTPVRQHTSRLSPDVLRRLKGRVQARLIEESDGMPAINALSRTEREEWVRQIEGYLEQEPELPPADRRPVAEDMLASIAGYGPIQGLLEDPSVDEIMVNGIRRVYVERRGRLEETPVAFATDDEVLQVIERIVSPLGRRIDEASPMVDARLPDGSRVNAIIPPLAIHGPSLTIRKFPSHALGAHDLIRFGTFTPQASAFLESCVRSRLNILVSGGTGSGKTTTLSVLGSFVPAHERIVTIEDAAELRLPQDHVVALETRPANLEGKGEVTVRMLVRNSLRMRPDRIIVGEVRGGETLDMLQAMNTGHDGSLTTAHANSPRDALSRLETMVLMAGMDLPVRAIREQIASAVDLIIHQARLRDGSRRITHIAEVQGMEGDVILLQDIFVFTYEGSRPDGKVSGRLRYTGIRPRVSERLLAAGLPLNLNQTEG